MPGPSELAFMVDEPLRRGEVPFSVSADVTVAQRHSWTGCVEVHAASPLLSVGVCRLPSLEFPGKNRYLNPKPT